MGVHIGSALAENAEVEHISLGVGIVERVSVNRFKKSQVVSRLGSYYAMAWRHFPFAGFCFANQI